jgi:hypothetical protein
MKENGTAFNIQLKFLKRKTCMNRLDTFIPLCQCLVVKPNDQNKFELLIKKLTSSNFLKLETIIIYYRRCTGLFVAVI